MPSLDVITLFNPTAGDFIGTWNGEDYLLKADSSDSFSKYVGFHLATNLAKQMINDSFTDEERSNVKKSVLISQTLLYDNPKLRIALYRILRSIPLVQECIMAYPYKGFVGDMDEYKNFVKKEEAKRIEKTEKTLKESPVDKSDKK